MISLDWFVISDHTNLCAKNFLRFMFKTEHNQQ